MMRTFFLVFVALMVVRTTAFDVTAQLVDRRVVHAFLANKDQGERATTFPADVLNIYLIWKGEGLQPGDEIRVVWIAEGVGEASADESKIGERSIPVHKSDDSGSCFVSRPRDRLWPVGKYRTEIYIGKRVVGVLRFTIRAGVSVEAH
jgi:hypothetical protein